MDKALMIESLVNNVAVSFQWPNVCMGIVLVLGSTCQNYIILAP